MEFKFVWKRKSWNSNDSPRREITVSKWSFLHELLWCWSFAHLSLNCGQENKKWRIFFSFSPCSIAPSKLLKTLCYSPVEFSLLKKIKNKTKQNKKPQRAVKTSLAEGGPLLKQAGFSILIVGSITGILLITCCQRNFNSTLGPFSASGGKKYMRLFYLSSIENDRYPPISTRTLKWYF